MYMCKPFLENVKKTLHFLETYFIEGTKIPENFEFLDRTKFLKIFIL